MSCALALALVCSGQLFATAVSSAEEFPSQAIELINNSKPGGGTDVFLRMASIKAGKITGQDIIIKSKSGGVATNALKYVASRPRDGYTVFSLLIGHAITILKGTTDLSVDDIVPLVRGTEDPNSIVVKAGAYGSMEDLLAAGKTEKLKIGGTKIGGANHIAALLFQRKAGLDEITYVPFKSAGEIVTNLVGGRIDIAILNYSEFESQHKAGTVTALAALAPERLAPMPDVPTGHEVGVPLNSQTVRGLGVMKGVPEERIAALEKIFLEAMEADVYQNYLNGSGMDSSSVAGREEWTKQFKEMFSQIEEIAPELGLIKKK
jgi:tripartite-type tricarboxylate transporter receptor subunit TctC